MTPLGGAAAPRIPRFVFCFVGLMYFWQIFAAFPSTPELIAEIRMHRSRALELKFKPHLGPITQNHLTKDLFFHLKYNLSPNSWYFRLSSGSFWPLMSKQNQGLVQQVGPVLVSCQGPGKTPEAPKPYVFISIGTWLGSCSALETFSSSHPKQIPEQNHIYKKQY